MHDPAASPLTRMIADLLSERGDTAPVGETDSLFLSGRLDSLAATQVMTMLEEQYGIDLADADFDITRLDTLAELRLLAREAA